MARPAQRKALILQAAEHLMARQGYDATAIADIAKAAQSSVGSITHFFGSKAHLALAVRDPVVSDLAQAISVALARHETDVAKTIEEVVAAFCAWRRAHPARAGLLKELAVVWVEGRSSANPLLTRLKSILNDWASPRIAAGHLPALPPALLLAVILGPAMMLSEMDGQEERDGPDAPALARHVASCVLDGIHQAATGAGSGRGDNTHGKRAMTLSAKREEAGRQLRLAGV